MNIVFTGKFEVEGQHIVRELLDDALENKGWHMQKAVDRRTDYLVASRHDTTKAQKAQDLGIAVISPDQFWAMVKQ